MPPDLYSIFANYMTLPNVRVSTTRVPIFDDLMQLPQHGYRGLGLLHELINSSQNILSIDLCSSLPDMQSWKNYLETQGAVLSHHFVLIITVDVFSTFDNIQDVLTGELASPYYSESSQFPTQADQFSTYPDFFYPITPTEFTIPGPFQSYSSFDSHRSQDSPFCAFPSYDNYNNVSTPLLIDDFIPPPSASSQSSPSRHDTPTIGIDRGNRFGIPDDISRLLTPGMPIGEMLRVAGVTEIQEAQARGRNSGSLWESYKRHHHGGKILEGLGFTVAAPTDRTVIYRGGLTITAGVILRHLDVSPRTFSNKTTAFKNAMTLANADRSWDGGMPSKGDPNFSSHLAWLGVVAMFRTDGFCHGDVAPQSNAASLHEVCAANLSQNTVLNRLKTLSDLTLLN